MWLLQFLFGMFLAYLLLSPRLRHWIFRRNHSPSLQSRVNEEEKRESKSQSTPITYKPEIENKEIPRYQSGAVFTTEDELAKWLRINPELREINKAK